MTWGVNIGFLNIYYCHLNPIARVAHLDGFRDPLEGGLLGDEGWISVEGFCLVISLKTHSKSLPIRANNTQSRQPVHP